MQNRLITVLKKFLPALIVILLLPVVIAFLFLPEGILYIPSEGFSYRWTLWLVAGIVIFVWLVSRRGRPRHHDPIAKKLYWLVVGPILLGLGLYLVSGQVLFFLGGIGLFALIVAWLNYLRFPARFWKVIQLTRQNQPVKALGLLSEMIQSHPDDWRAHQMRSNLYLNQFQFVNAERDARLILKLKPTPQGEDHVHLAEVLHSQAQYADAVQSLRTALQMKSDRSFWYQLGVEYYRLGQYEEAIQALLEATRFPLPLMMANLLANYYLGCSYENLGNPNGAKKYFREMRKHGQPLQQAMAAVNGIPDYPEAIKLRTDYVDIEKRLA